MKNLISVLFVLAFISISCGRIDFPYKYSGLLWSEVSRNPMTWDEAISYCEKLDGRLPTISELRTLIQNCPKNEIGGACGVTYECLSYLDCWNESCYGCEYDKSGKYSFFGDVAWLWSSSKQSDNEYSVWDIDFASGHVLNHNENEEFNVRCVR